MTLVLTEDHKALRDSVRAFFSARSTEADVRRLMGTEPGYDAATWSAMGKELGIQGLAIPEEFGGTGATAVELAVVFEEAGRALLCAPLLSTVALAATLLLQSGDEQARERYLPAIAAGDLVATVAVTEDSGTCGEGEVRVGATPHADGWALSGVKSFVPDGAAAQLILVVARAEDGIGVFAVDAAAPGLARQSLPALDQTRPLARLEFSGTPATRIDGADWALVRATLDQATALLAAEQVGVAERLLEMSVDYAKVRHQFGRPIGSFQAIKHKCADMLVSVEKARAAAYHAIEASAEDPAALPMAAALAGAFCGPAATAVANATIQVHGGIGFTWEHPVHLYLKRAKAAERLFGGPHHHRAIIAELVGA
jgi:alkylation response protein AidB-like acyl-CoA dehydrogenase